MLPPTRIAQGITRRGFSISSPIADPASTPPNAKKTLDQKTALLRLQCGISAAAVKWIAGPKRTYDAAASSISALNGSRLPSELMLFSHLPTFTPRMFSSVMMVSHTTEKAR